MKNILFAIVAFSLLLSACSEPVDVAVTVESTSQAEFVNKPNVLLIIAHCSMLLE